MLVLPAAAQRRLCGIVAQADIARKCGPDLTSAVLKEISVPSAA